MADRMRIHVGGSRRMGVRYRIYRTENALEIDEIEDNEIRRTRLFYDEVLLVTRHRAVPWMQVVVASVLLLLTAAFSVLASMGPPHDGRMLGFTALFWGPMLLAVILLAVVQVDVVTIYGKRTRARLEFFLRKGRAAQVFQQICRDANDHQARLRREVAAAAPQPAVERPPLADGGA
jgi:hypothetical protein